MRHITIIMAALLLSSVSATAQTATEARNEIMRSAAGISAPDYSEYILTPPAPDTPRINGPRIYGARCKADFLFRIPATGLRPMTFSAKGLPNGLK